MNHIIRKHYANGQLRQIEHRDENGFLHRDDGPALELWLEDGQKSCEWYCLHGKRHREDGPADIGWHKNGQKRCEYYWVNGRLHRENGPAITIWYTNGKLRSEDHYVDGKRKSKKHLPAREWYIVEEWLGDSTQIYTAQLSDDELAALKLKNSGLFTFCPLSEKQITLERLMEIMR